MLKERDRFRVLPPRNAAGFFPCGRRSRKTAKTACWFLRDRPHPYQAVAVLYQHPTNPVAVRQHSRQTGAADKCHFDDLQHHREDELQFRTFQILD